MTDISNASRGVKLALLEGQLLSRQIDRHVFLEGATRLGLSTSNADAAAGKFLAIAANQVARRADLNSSYDYIVIGSGASGAVVARRLAENPQTTVMLLEAGGEDLKPSILMTGRWGFNQGTDVDWGFQAEPSKSVNNRSIKQAMGKALGGGRLRRKQDQQCPPVSPALTKSGPSLLPAQSWSESGIDSHSG